MTSRGKYIVQLALQSQNLVSSTAINSIPTSSISNDTNVKTKDISNKNNTTASECFDDPAASQNIEPSPMHLDTPDVLFATKVDCILRDCNNNNTESEKKGCDVLSKNDSSAQLLCYESDISEEFDDDVRDPNWKPVKQDKDISESDTDVEDTGVNSTPQTCIQPLPNEVDASVLCDTRDGIDHEEIVQTSDYVSKGKRKTDPSNWKRNVQKRLRMSGKAFQGYKKSEGKYVEAERSGRILTDRGCSKRCRKSGKNRQCNMLTEEDRHQIFNTFWTNLDWHGKKVFVASLIDCKSHPHGDMRRRKVSYTYHLKCKGVKVPVCKSMFLTTLGIGEKMMYGWIENAEQNAGTPYKPETKARGIPEAVRHSANNFLDNLPKLPSHYCRSTTSKLYLENTFTTLAEVYRVYKDYCRENSKSCSSRKVFESVFHEKNLSLYRPKKDKCDICCSYEVGNLAEKDYNDHLSKKTASREEKNADKERARSNLNIKVLTMDLEAVLLAPRLNASALYYKTKLASHNFTIYDLATNDVSVYFWNESEGDLCASSFASCVTHYIKGLPTNITEVVLYSDGCTYQNRNAVLANALLSLAKERHITIIQKYLTKGHTQMECDSVHSTLEHLVRNKPVYSPFTYVEALQSARPRKKYTVHYLTHDFFQDFTDLVYYSSIRPGTQTGDPVVTDVVCFKYLQDGTAQYKLSFDDKFKDLPRRVTRRSNPIESGNHVWPCLHKGPLPIKGSKYKHLQELKAVIPPDFHGFYDNLPHTNT